MPAGWAAAIGAAGSIASSAISAGAAGDAASQQAAGLQASLGLQSRMYDQSRQDLAPYLQGGSEANGLLLNLLGLQDPNARGGSNYRVDTPTFNSPDFQSIAAPIYAKFGIDPNSPDDGSANRHNADVAVTNAWSALAPKQDASNTPGFGSLLHQFDASDLNANLAPNYAFMLDQGQQATKNMANASGGLIGGNALQGLDTFTQNYAQNAYQQAYNNYNTNMNNIFSRLSGVAQMGQNSATQSASNAISAGQNMGNTTAQIGAAQAGGTVGAANALSGGLNNLGSYYSLASIMNGSGSVAPSQYAYGATDPTGLYYPEQ